MKTFESLAFYRGMSIRYPFDRPSIGEPRTNRRPRDSSRRFHEAVDQWFFERFGVRYRSQATFVTARTLTAQAYAASPAHVMRIVPLNEYRYCWSPNVSDLLFKAKELSDAGVEAVRDFLKSAKYQEDDLENAHAAGYEVMLYCERYVAIPIGLLSDDDTSGASGILLPFGS